MRMAKPVHRLLDRPSDYRPLTTPKTDGKPSYDEAKPFTSPVNCLSLAEDSLDKRSGILPRHIIGKTTWPFVGTMLCRPLLVVA